MTALWPRLLPAASAKRYMGGLDPMIEFGATPQFRRGEVFYDRVELDQLLDAGRESAPPVGDDPDSALQAWIEGHGAA
jgi:hypothetical protein